MSTIEDELAATAKIADNAEAELDQVKREAREHQKELDAMMNKANEKAKEAERLEDERREKLLAQIAQMKQDSEAPLMYPYICLIANI